MQFLGVKYNTLTSDFKTALLGSFQDGVLEAAKATTLKTVIDDRGMKIPVFNSHDNEDACPIYKREVSSSTRCTNKFQEKSIFCFKKLLYEPFLWLTERSERNHSIPWGKFHYLHRYKR